MNGHLFSIDFYHQLDYFTRGETFFHFVFLYNSGIHSSLQHYSKTTSKLVLAKNSSLLQRNYSTTISKLVFVKIPQCFNEIILRQFQNLSSSKFLNASTKLFYDNFKTCLGQKSSSLQRNMPTTISKLVLAKVPHRFNDVILRQFQNLSLPQILLREPTCTLPIFHQMILLALAKTDRSRV